LKFATQLLGITYASAETFGAKRQTVHLKNLEMRKSVLDGVKPGILELDYVTMPFAPLESGADNFLPRTEQEWITAMAKTDCAQPRNGSFRQRIAVKINASRFFLHPRAGPQQSRSAQHNSANSDCSFRAIPHDGHGPVRNAAGEVRNWAGI
jgi:hypothetical protein